MRQRKCNSCEQWSNVDDWGFGCPACGHGNGHEVSYSEYPGTLVMPDIKPYKSMIDGSEITSRSRHRKHLREHDCFEIGNDTAALFKKPDLTLDPERKELIAAQIRELGHDGLKKALKRDIDFIRWNSRNLPKGD